MPREIVAESSNGMSFLDEKYGVFSRFLGGTVVVI